MTHSINNNKSKKNSYKRINNSINALSDKEIKSVLSILNKVKGA